MDQRHYSPDQIKTIGHSLQKQNSKTLRQGGSSSNFFAKQSMLFQQQSQNIGDYTFSRKNMIGTGYTSKVYKCKHSKQQGQFALKIIDLKKYSASSLQMLQNEIQILKVLDHPNIIKFKNFYRTANHCFLVTQYCSHGDLLEYLTRQGKLGQKEAIYITGQIIEAVKYLFKHGIIHRDIKPANIFKGNKNWKLGDFGFAMRCQGQVKTKHNVGTPLYMPLQALLRNSYSAQSDIFAIGVILYEMMVGFTPWQCKSQKQLLKKMNTLPFSIPDKIKVNTSVRYLMTKLCAINRDERMSKEQFVQLNINNFTNLIYFNEINKQTDNYRKNRLYSNTKLLKQQSKHKDNENEYLTKKYKPDQKSKQKLQTLNEKIRANSNKNLIDYKVYGTATRKQSLKSGSSQKRFQLKLQQRAYDVLLSQLNYCRFMYYLIQNNMYVPINQINRNRLSLVLFKHLLKIIKQLADNKNNWYGFSNWDNLRKSQKYQNTFKALRQYCQKYQRQYLIFLKKAQINVIKEINQKLPQFSTQQQFSKIFYRKIQNFIIPFLKQSISSFTGQIQQNISKLQGIRSLYKYYQLLQMNIKEYQNYSYFCNNHGINVIKNYRKTEITLNQYLPIKQAIKML